MGQVGGLGFSNDGVIEQTADSFYAAVRSRIKAHQSAGMNLKDSNYGELPILSLEAAYEAALGGQGLELDDYKLFKARGLVALRRVKALGYVFQSDVTCVLRATDKAIAPAYRRFVTDNLIDESYDIGVKYKDAVNDATTRDAIRVQLRGLLQTYVRAGAIPDKGYNVKLDSSPQQVDAGLLIYIVTAKLNGVINAIAFRLRVGAEGVDAEELAA